MIFCLTIPFLKTFALEQSGPPQPSGDVSGVCWSLLGAMAIALIGSLKYHTDKLDKKEEEIKALNAARLEDKEKSEAQINVMIQAIAKKKGESP